MLILSYEKFSAKNAFFQNFETDINFALLEYHYLHLTICLTTKNFIQRMFGGTKTLSVNKNHFKRMTLPLTNLLSTRGLDMSPSSTPGEVQSRFQQIFQSSVNLGQSSQGFNRSFKVQLTWGSPVKISRNLSIYRVTWGKSPSSSLGAFECQKCSTIPSSPAGSYNHQQNNGQFKLLKICFSQA